MAKMLQKKPVFALPGCQRMSVNTFWCDNFWMISGGPFLFRPLCLLLNDGHDENHGNLLVGPSLQILVVKNLCKPWAVQTFRKVPVKHFLREAKPGGFLLFSGKVQIVSRTLSGLFLVGALNRPRKRKGTNRENPRRVPEQIRKIPEKSGKPQKGQNPCPSFLVIFCFPGVSLLGISLVFLSVFCLLDFKGSQREENPWCFWGFPWYFRKKTKEKKDREKENKGRTSPDREKPPPVWNTPV